MKHLFVFLIIFAVFLPATSALQISDVSISPDQDTLIGQDITGAFTITPTQYDLFTYNPNNSIEIITGLTDPTWDRQTYLDGAVSRQQTKSNIMILEGWDLAYSFRAGDHINESISIQVKGKAPAVLQSSQVTVISITEYDPTGQEVPGSHLQLQKVVVNQTDFISAIYLADKDLARLKSDIETFRKQDIDVTIANLTYYTAQNNLDLLRYIPANQYLVGLVRLQEITDSIRSAEETMNHDLTQREIDMAIIPLQKTDRVIGWFKGNESTKNYPGLANLTIRRDYAANGITDAISQMMAKEHLTARTTAHDSFLLANETLYSSLALQKKAMDPLTPIYDNIIFVEIGVVVIVGYLLLRKKKRKGKKHEVKGKGTGSAIEDSNPGITEISGESTVSPGEIQPGSK